MTKFQWLPIMLALIFLLAQSPAQEPLRAGIDVPEPKLLKKVEIEYPEEAKLKGITGPVVLDIIINELGIVTNAYIRNHISAFPSSLESVPSSIKQWRFSPTLLNGKAAPVKAKVVLLFEQTYAQVMGIDLEMDVQRNDQIDLGISAGWLPQPTFRRCYFPVLMNRSGHLKEIPAADIRISGNDGTLRFISQKEYCGDSIYKYYALIPESDAPISLTEDKLNRPEAHTVYNLRAPQFRLPDLKFTVFARPGLNRLYYSALFSITGSQLIQLVGADPDVQPPLVNLDFDALNAILKKSLHYKAGNIYFFTVFVDEAGSILGVGTSGNKYEAITMALSNATVLAPGTRNGKPVPTAVIVAIPVK